MKTTIFIPGTPQPQGSKKHIGRGRMIEQNKHLKPWRKTIANHTKHLTTTPIDDPLTITAEFVFPRLKTMKPTSPLTKKTAPDVDKLCRAVGDALERDAGIITNDSRITAWHATKRYTAQTEPPGLHLTIETMSEK